MLSECCLILFTPKHHSSRSNYFSFSFTLLEKRNFAIFRFSTYNNPGIFVASLCKRKMRPIVNMYFRVIFSFQRWNWSDQSALSWANEDTWSRTRLKQKPRTNGRKIHPLNYFQLKLCLKHAQWKTVSNVILYIMPQHSTVHRRLVLRNFSCLWVRKPPEIFTSNAAVRFSFLVLWSQWYMNIFVQNYLSLSTNIRVE